MFSLPGAETKCIGSLGHELRWLHRSDLEGGGHGGELLELLARFLSLCHDAHRERSHIPACRAHLLDGRRSTTVRHDRGEVWGLTGAATQRKASSSLRETVPEPLESITEKMHPRRSWNRSAVESW